MAQLVKNPPAMQETPVRFLGWEDPLEKYRLPTPVFLGFPCGSAGKNSVCNAGDLGLIPGLERSPGEGKFSWPGEFHGLYSPWGHKELDATEQLSLFTSLSTQSRAFHPCPQIHDYQSIRAAITNCYSLGSLYVMKTYFLQFWSLEVWVSL